MYEHESDKCIAIKKAVVLGDADMLKVLFEAYIKEHEKTKMEHDDAMIISSLNPILEFESINTEWNMSPLYVAAFNGNIEMVKVFVEHISYIDNVNQRCIPDFMGPVSGPLCCDGLAPIEAAANKGHFEIVNILMPLTTDLEFQTTSEISCTCIKLKQFIQDKINQFIVKTGKTNPLLKNPEVIARSYLSHHNWNLKSAIEKFSASLWQEPSTAEKHKALLNFKEETNFIFEETVAISYLSQNNWNSERATEALCNYRSNFDEWQKWSSQRQEQQDLTIQNCNCCEIPQKNVQQEIPDIDLSEIVLDDSDNSYDDEEVEDEEDEN